MTEDERLLRVRRRRAEQALVVRVAADDPVHHDDVGWLDAVRIRGDVVLAALDARLVDTGLAQQPASLALVGGRELEAHRVRRTTLEQLELDLADPAADLEHRSAVETRALQERHHAA